MLNDDYVIRVGHSPLNAKYNFWFLEVFENLTITWLRFWDIAENPEQIIMFIRRKNNP